MYRTTFTYCVLCCILLKVFNTIFSLSIVVYKSHTVFVTCICTSYPGLNVICTYVFACLDYCTPEIFSVCFEHKINECACGCGCVKVNSSQCKHCCSIKRLFMSVQHIMHLSSMLVNCLLGIFI